MPTDTVLQRRDRALIAFSATTAGRVNALASFRLEHVDPADGFVDHDARTARSKFANTFRTVFMPVMDGAHEIVADWTTELQRE